jgi:EAL domain-containing protein (putative c-di-GMP-specific phosphodiesterase class I)
MLVTVSASEGRAEGGVLLVDDDEEVLRAHARILERAGVKIQTAKSGEEALAALESGQFDLVVSDIWMPKMDGIALLEHVRTVDLDVPVILVTGAISEPLSLKAVEHGALRTLVKPLDQKSLVAAVKEAIGLGRLARARRAIRRMTGSGEKQLGDVAALVTRFQRALKTVYLVYQPVVDVGERKVVGWEAFLRSEDEDLVTPTQVFEAADRIGRLPLLGKTIRERFVADAANLPAGALAFLKVLPLDLNDALAFAEELPADLRARTVLEISERSSLASIVDATRSAVELRNQGYAFAVDDFGASETGLSRFAAFTPVYTKLARLLVDKIAEERPRQFVVRTMVDECRELGMKVVAKNVERPEERDALIDVGCNLMQGYLFGRPERGFVAPKL